MVSGEFLCFPASPAVDFFKWGIKLDPLIELYMSIALDFIFGWSLKIWYWRWCGLDACYCSDCIIWSFLAYFDQSLSIGVCFDTVLLSNLVKCRNGWKSLNLDHSGCVPGMKGLLSTYFDVEACGLVWLLKPCTYRAWTDIRIVIMTR
jgi:hypothetical protein